MIGTDRIDRLRWTLPPAHGAPLVPVALSGASALALEPRLDLSPLTGDPLSALFFVFASSSRVRSTRWALGPDGPVDLATSRLELECHCCRSTRAVRVRSSTAATEARSAAARDPGLP